MVDAQADAQPEAFGKAISYFRNRCHFAIACGELWGKISFEHSLSMLSRIAEQAVDSTASYLVRSAGLTDSRWIILALGKLSAEELNYSSDLDLICLFDMHPHADDAGDSCQPVYPPDKRAGIIAVDQHRIWGRLADRFTAPPCPKCYGDLPVRASGYQLL